MKRSVILVVTAVVAMGCQCPAPPGADPFFGRTRVPPPGTGAISGGLSDPYYRGPVQPVTPPAARPQLPSGTNGQPTAPSGGQRYAPPGGSYQYQGSPTSGARLSGASRAKARVPTPSVVAKNRARTSERTNKLAGREPVIRILQPQPQSVARSQRTRTSRPPDGSATREPGRLNVAAGAVDIMDLPRARSSAARSHGKSASDLGGFRLASGTEDVSYSDSITAADGASAAQTDAGAAEFTAKGGFGYDPEYKWLRGKLEYSQIDRRWKLRYIPVDGKTDEFGGSVVLADPSVLTGYERGDFVEVRGKLGRQSPKKGYAPVYEVAEVQRLGR